MALCGPGLSAWLAVGAGEPDFAHCWDGSRPSSTASVAPPRVLERPCANGTTGWASYVPLVGASGATSAAPLASSATAVTCSTCNSGKNLDNFCAASGRVTSPRLARLTTDAAAVVDVCLPDTGSS